MTSAARTTSALLATASVLVGCDTDEPLVWSRFNAPDDTVQVSVGAELPEADGLCDGGLACADLHSRVEGAVIGDASVDPAAGPVGTEHRVLVVIGDEWEELVDRTSVTITSDRGQDSFDLEQDPANPGAWGLTLESMGANSEIRDDDWVVTLWQAIPESQATTTGTVPVTTSR